MIYFIVFMIVAFLFIFIGGIVAASIEQDKKWYEILKGEGRDD